jgi:signal transduction histidine kinase
VQSDRKAGEREARIAPAAEPRPVSLWLWLLGFLAYASISIGALLVGGEPSVLKAALYGALNAFPELAAGPLALAWLDRRLRRQGIVWPAIAGVAILFVSWCVVASRFAALLTAGRPLLEVPRGMGVAVLIWRGAMALLVFAVLAALAAARLRASQAQAAALRAERAERLRASAELSALRSHLNPHFVLNVLHSLIGLTTREPERAADCLERLGAILRYGLALHAEGRDLVTLGEELAMTKQYLEIERMRLGDRLRVEWRVEDAALQARVPPFSLQPLVENAIRHAVAPRAGGGRLRIAIERDETGVRFSVEDDGAPAGSPLGEGGLGHHLLTDRLHWLFGDRARFSTRALEPAGFRAAVAIEHPEPPEHPEDAEDDE